MATQKKKQVLVNMKEIAALANVSYSTVRRWVLLDHFPGCVRVGRITRWFETEIKEWLHERKN